MHQTPPPRPVLSAQAKRKLASALHQATRQLMLDVAADDLMLAEVVAGGRYHWALNCLREYACIGMTHSITDEMFRFFEIQALRRFGALENAKKVLDSAEVTSPPTAAEIESAWVHHCDSSEDARRQFYKDGNPVFESTRKPILVSTDAPEGAPEKATSVVLTD